MSEIFECFEVTAALGDKWEKTKGSVPSAERKMKKKEIIHVEFEVLGLRGIGKDKSKGSVPSENQKL